MGFSSRTRVRVRYADTDQMGFVYHANYLVWFEVGRAEFFRGLDLPYKKFEEQGLRLTVVEASCRYRKPARYDDELIIETEIEHLSFHSVRFCYHVYREETLLAEGKTVHVFINTDGRLADVRQYPIWNVLHAIIDKHNSTSKK